jgi:hypothetical protein
VSFTVQATESDGVHTVLVQFTPDVVEVVVDDSDNDGY